MAIERDSGTWQAVKKHCEAGIERGRDELEGCPTSEQSNYLRGRIKVMREILDLAKPKPEIKSEDTLY